MAIERKETNGQVQVTPKYTVTIEQTSGSLMMSSPSRGYSILRIMQRGSEEWTDGLHQGDTEFLPTVSQQMPTEVAEWIKSLAEIEKVMINHINKE